MTSTEQVKIAFWTSLTNANAGMKWLDHDSMDEMIEAAWVGFEGPALEALSRNTPADGEVERVALALGAELKRSCGDRAWADNRRSGEDNILAEVDGEIDLEDLARAAIASLPPKPVDGEVAELVERLHSFSRSEVNCQNEPAREYLQDLVRQLRLALSRNTEPMVTDAVARAARDFCAELKEDAEGVPQPQLKRLHEALDVWEMVPPEQLYDDSTPESSLLAALKWIVEDGSLPDRVRQTARAAMSALSRNTEPMVTDAGSLAQIEGEEIVIRVPFAAIPNAAEIAWNNGGHGPDCKFFVEDVPTFAKELVGELNREEENGDTPIHRMLDKAVCDATNNGAFGIGELSAGKKGTDDA